MKRWIRKWTRNVYFKIVLHHLLVCRTAVVFALKSGDQGVVEEKGIRADLKIQQRK